MAEYPIINPPAGCTCCGSIDNVEDYAFWEWEPRWAGVQLLLCSTCRNGRDFSQLGDLLSGVMREAGSMIAAVIAKANRDA